MGNYEVRHVTDPEELRKLTEKYGKPYNSHPYLVDAKHDYVMRNGKLQRRRERDVGPFYGCYDSSDGRPCYYRK